MLNPYRKALKSTPFKLPGQSNQFTDNKGEINASSTADLLVQIGNAMKAPQTVTASKAQTNVGVHKERRKILVEAMGDQSGRLSAVLGEALAAEINETTNREGFTRRIMQYNEIGQGETNEVVLKEKDVIAFLATSPSSVNPVEIRQKRQYPPEFHINGYILIDTGELARSSGDLLGDKYEEGLEAVMVKEDVLWRTMAVQAATVRNTLQNFATFTPSVFARLINQVSRWGIPATSCLFASDLWQDVISNGDFAGVFDPVTQWELLQEGYLGSMYGVSMLTDNFRQPNLKVLDVGEIFITGAPINHGVFTLRGSVTAEPINKFAEGEAKKGWFLDEICSMVLGNTKSVSRGQKI